MRLYESLEVVPSRVLGLLRLVDYFRGNGLLEEVAVQLLQPKTLLKSKDADATQTLARETIRASIELGVMEQRTQDAGDRLFLAPEVTDEVGRLRLAQLPSVLARLAFRPEVGGKPNQFARICAWFLWQTPTDMPQGHAALKDRMSAQGVNLDEVGLRNDARWDNVIYWMTYFGLLWQTKTEKCRGLVPDPSAFVRAHLDTLLPGDERAITAGEFRAALGALCPVLDGGATHTEIGTKLTGEAPEDRFSPALSFALRYLRDAGAIRFWCPDDQRGFLLLTHDDKIAFVSRARETD